MKKKIFFVLLPILILTFFFEITFRYYGFGNPVLYNHNKGYYYLKPNQNIKRFKGSRVKINRLGMRTNYYWEDIQNLEKIIFFGDSVTFGGSYIDNKDLFSEKFCLEVKKSICGNYGVNGFMIDNLNDQINDKIKNIDFSHFIIVVSDSITVGKSVFYDFPFYQQFQYKIFKATIEILNHILFKYNVADNYHKTKIKDDNISKNEINDFIKTLKELKKNKAKISIFILPTIENLTNKNYSSHFLEDIKIKDVNIYNMYHEIKNLNFENLYFNNAHLNKKGHDYFSKMIYNKIK